MSRERERERNTKRKVTRAHVAINQPRVYFYTLYESKKIRSQRSTVLDLTLGCHSYERIGKMRLAGELEIQMNKMEIHSRLRTLKNLMFKTATWSPKHKFYI
jgi:hypothetical protein